MTRIHDVFLFAVVIVMMITAGCSTSTTGPSPLMTPGESPAATAATTAPPAPAGTGQPGAAGTAAQGTCTADISSDAANCGGCGFACPANALCQQGQCYCKEGYTAENNACVVAPAGTGTGTGCPAGMTACPDGYCYELASSPSNCGICGNICPSGMMSTASTCTAVPAEVTTEATTSVTTTTTTGGTGLSTKTCFIRGQTNCGGECVVLNTSSSHCGACKTKCTSATPTCCGGKCVNLKTDKTNCGTCGKKCGTGLSCISGSCTMKAANVSVIGSGLSKIQAVPSLVKYKDPGSIIGPGGM